MSSENFIYDYKRKKQLGYFGKFYAPQKDVLPIAFKALQEEVRKEYDAFLKHGYKSFSVIRLKSNKDKKRFAVAHSNFEGRKFKEFAKLNNVLTCDNSVGYNDFWQKISQNEEDEITDTLCQIGSQIMKLKIKFDKLSDKNIAKQISLKILGRNKDSVRNDITELSDKYVEFADVLRCWSQMSSAEKKSYVARRYLFTGALQFEPDSVSKYYQNYSRTEKVALQNAEAFDIFD